MLTRLEAAVHFLFDQRVMIAAIALRLIGALLSFATIFLVARTSGAAVTGDYAMAVQTSLLVSLIATLGLDQIATRLIGGDLREGRADLARAALRAVLLIVVPMSVLAAIIVAVGSPLASRIGASQAAMLAVAASIAVYPLLRIGVVVLRAAGSTLWSQFFRCSPWCDCAGGRCRHPGKRTLIYLVVLACGDLFSSHCADSAIHMDVCREQDAALERPRGP